MSLCPNTKCDRIDSSPRHPTAVSSRQPASTSMINPTNPTPVYHPNVARRLLAQSCLSIFTVSGDKTALIRTFHHSEAWRRLDPPRMPVWVPKRSREVRGPPRASKARSSHPYLWSCQCWKQAWRKPLMIDGDCPSCIRCYLGVPHRAIEDPGQDTGNSARPAQNSISCEHLHYYDCYFELSCGFPARGRRMLKPPA